MLEQWLTWQREKADKYSSLGAGYSFTPIAIETLGAMGKRSLAFLKELGHRMRQCTGEVKAKAYLSTMSLCSSTENECSFGGGTVGAGPF